MGQSEFSEKIMFLSDDNDKKMKKSMKAYNAFEFNVSEVKKMIRKNTDSSKPVEFTLNLDDQKFHFLGRCPHRTIVRKQHKYLIIN